MVSGGKASASEASKREQSRCLSRGRQTRRLCRPREWGEVVREQPQEKVVGIGSCAKRVPICGHVLSNMCVDTLGSASDDVDDKDSSACAWAGCYMQGNLRLGEEKKRKVTERPTTLSKTSAWGGGS